jgi:hypothetical protein
MRAGKCVGLPSLWRQSNDRYYGANATRILGDPSHLGGVRPGRAFGGLVFGLKPERGSPNTLRGRHPYNARSADVPHKFEAHPDHPAVAYLVPLHADLGGRIQANKDEAVPCGPRTPSRCAVRPD